MEASDDNRSLLCGSEVEIFKLVSEGASPGQRDKWLRAPLQHAAAEGHLDKLVKASDGGHSILHGSEVEIFKLVSDSASPEQWAKWLRAPLEYAAAKGNLDLVTNLLQAGANGGVGWRGLDGRTLLVAAVEGDNEEVVQALLWAGARAEVDIQFGDNYLTALLLAITKGAEAVAKRLLKAGADPNLTDAFTNGALHLAAEEGHHRMIGELVLHGMSVNRRNWREETPLFVAVVNGCVDAAEQLLLAGADIEMFCLDEKDSQNYIFVLSRASLTGNLEMVNLLLRHGADVSQTDRTGLTALHCLHGFPYEEGPSTPRIVRALLKAGAHVNAKTSSDWQCHKGSTPLHFAAKMAKSNDTILALLQGGADVNCQTDSGQTPLHLACLSCNIAGAKVLLRWGADETAIDGEGRTAADVTPHAYDNVDLRADLLRILARVPADRAWRRRGWLVLCRYYPNRARLTSCDGGSSEANGEAISSNSHTRSSRAKVGKPVDGKEMARDGGGVAGEGGEAAEDMMRWQSLVTRVVRLDVEGVFRKVVGFL